jgi:hypothetical protein
MKIQYTSLKYYNSPISEECLYVGILFYNLTTGERTFNTIRKFSRLESFDDELDVNFMKLYLHSIKEEIEGNIFNYSKEFDLQSYINTYVNQLRFSNITTVDTADADFINNTTKIFLKFDYEKNERLDKDTEKKYIKRLLLSACPNLSEEKIQGKYNEDIKFDFKINNCAIKMFSFKEKDLNRMIAFAKHWSFNAHEMKKHYNTVFIYDHELKENPQFDIIIKILKENASYVLPVEEGLEFITSTCS